MDINAAIDAYSHVGGNTIRPLQELCGGGSIVAERLAAEINELQESILELVRARSGANGLSRAQIEQLARQYLAGVRPDVNDVGARGLLGYIVWIAWHDGWLRVDSKA